jgi:hypothetical protein
MKTHIMKTNRITASPLRKSGLLNNSTIAVTRGILTAVMALALWVGATNLAHAQLTGSGSHIPLAPTPVVPFPAVGAPYINTSPTTWTGTWNSSPVPTAWLGTFTVTGVNPAGTSVGLQTYDFSGLTGGVLPANSWFVIGDLDSGSGTEQITLKAYDSTHTPIALPWLNSPALDQNGTGVAGGAPQLTDMPGWDWNGTTANTYTFNGNTVGNPNVGLALGNNQNISFLEVSLADAGSGTSGTVFHLEAPTTVPEPSTMALLAGGFGALFFFRRRRSGTINKSQGGLV